MRSRAGSVETAAYVAGAAALSFANAVFVGAKTVNGPLPESVFASPACLTSATRVVKRLSAAAVPTIVFVPAVCSAGAAERPRCQQPRTERGCEEQYESFLHVYLQFE